MPESARYLRVSLLSRCNLSCSYCNPSGFRALAVRQTSPQQFSRGIEILHRNGIRKVRFTGGEPTLYRELPQLISFVKSLSNDTTTAITSNGLLLDRLASPLARAGLDSINISLDTLDRQKCKRITGTDSLPRALAGIKAAMTHISSVKLNCVVMAGTNDEEVEGMIRQANSWGVDIRFIEFMPTKQAGRGDHRFISGCDLRADLPFDFRETAEESSSPARYYQSDQLRIKVGFIDPVSRPFCSSCDRIRLAADGRVYGCLYTAECFNLFETLKEGEPVALQRLNQLLASKASSRSGRISSLSAHLPSFIDIGG